jgi:hypothetical protein
MRVLRVILNIVAISSVVGHRSVCPSVSTLAPHLQLKCHGACRIRDAIQMQRLRGGGNSVGGDGDAITEEQAGEELIKAASNNNVDGMDPPGIEILVSSGAPVNYQVSFERIYKNSSP